MKRSEFHYPFPKALIAQHPLAQRDASRMMVVDRTSGTLTHTGVRDLPTYLRPGDLLIVNNSKVLPMRLIGQRPNGAPVEILLLRKAQSTERTAIWSALAKPMKAMKPGLQLTFGETLTAEILGRENDEIQIQWQTNGNFTEVLEQIGLPPLPPYIDRPTGHVALDDHARYQTTYAKPPGSAAAPTAGLHFSETLLQQCRNAGAEIAEVTLHVGRDTFQPVRVDTIEDHHMHGEHYEIPQDTWEAIQEIKGSNRRLATDDRRRVLAVGTTSVRALESAAALGTLSGDTHLFIYPGYQFQLVDAVLTNFHQPESTLLMLVSAFAGKPLIDRAYAEAIAQEYRLFSYGDCMLLQGTSRNLTRGDL